MNFLIKFLATGFFVGYLPFAPGTAATLLALGIYLLLPTRFALALARQENLSLYLIFIFFSFFFGVYLAGKAEKLFGNKDDRRIVIDEIIGFFVAMLFLPGTPKFIFLVFLLFRFFDIFKFSIIRKVQSLPGGWGVMLDDLFAGLFTNFILQFLRLTKIL